MKTTMLLTSLFFGSLAVAAPLKQRALVTATEIVTETVIVYTTVWDDDVPEATLTSAAVEKKPSTPASPQAEPTSAPAYLPSQIEEPSSVFTPPPPSSSQVPEQTSEPTPEPEPTSVYTPPPPPPTPAAPEPSSVYTPPPAPVSSSPPAPATSDATPPPSGPFSGEVYHGDITIYDNNGGYGACGDKLYDSDMIVALAQGTFGASTYNSQTGKPTNKWCGKWITVEYNGNSIDAKIADVCPGCNPGDVDLSLAAWKKLTGMDEKTRIQGSWHEM